MGLCTHFINGNCRFGSKCVNDHIDLKTLLKNEADAVINGKQWILSCFGPFKESVVIPNFINDQSFEEIRIGFMESSKNGNVQNFLSNLMAEYNNAMAKMIELKTPSNDSLQLITSIYNTSTSSDQKAKPAQSQAPNPFQSSNVFGGSTSQQTMPSSSIFGSSTTQNNPFQQAATQQPASSIFGSSTSNNPAQSSPFSFNQAPQDQQKSSIFGQSSVFGSTPAPVAGSVFSNNQSSIFGQQASTFAMPATQPGQSVFGSSTVQQPTQSIFGSVTAQQPTQSVFGTTQSVFGATPAPQQAPQSVFGGTTTQQPAQNIFGGNTVQNPPVQNVFGTPAAAQSQPVQNIFGGGTVSAQQPAQNVFGGIAAPQPSQNVFSQAVNQQPAQNVFSQATNPQNTFGGFTQSQPQNPQPFAQSSSVFGSTSQPPQQAESTPAGNIFNTQAPQPSQQNQVFGGNPFQQNVAFNDEHFYSKDTELPPEAVQAYQAESFNLGNIPLLPPTKSLALS